MICRYLFMALMMLGICPTLAQAAPFRIGVFTPGMASEPVFLGFKEGLNRLGY